MRVNLNVKELISSVAYYIEEIADEDNITNDTLRDEDGCELKFFHTKDELDIFRFLSVESGKELFNELFVKDDTIMNAFKSFAEDYGYVAKPIELDDYDDYAYPIFQMRKKIDINVSDSRKATDIYSLMV